MMFGSAGLSFEPVVVDIDSLDAPSAATASSKGSKALGSKATGATNSSSAAAAAAASGFDWQSLWGVEVNEGVLDNIAERSFLLGKHRAALCSLQSAFCFRRFLSRHSCCIFWCHLLFPSSMAPDFSCKPYQEISQITSAVLSATIFVADRLPPHR
jgi:hypothetical protein